MKLGYLLLAVSLIGTFACTATTRNKVTSGKTTTPKAQSQKAPAKKTPAKKAAKAQSKLNFAWAVPSKAEVLQTHIEDGQKVVMKYDVTIEK